MRQRAEQFPLSVHKDAESAFAQRVDESVAVELPEKWPANIVGKLHATSIASHRRHVAPALLLC